VYVQSMTEQIAINFVKHISGIWSYIRLERHEIQCN
jgi:hypothetical protein